MLICLVTLTTILIFLEGTESSLLEPVRKCVPTATVRGPCHVCVCSTEGVFHCRSHECQDENLERKRPLEDCGPNYLYREDNTFCTCSNYGSWKSQNCKDKFKYLKPRIPSSRTQMETNIACMADKFYLIDCNICQCATSGIIEMTLCTNRYCAQGHKADSCNYGDILRLEHEICSCSNISYYIDRLCINILDQVAQTLTTEDVSNLIDVGRSWRRLHDLRTSNCNREILYSVDCNQCICTEGSFTCTTISCNYGAEENSLRHDQPEYGEILSELDTMSESCVPGKKYRYKCNTCVCSNDGTPSCTTMVCLDDHRLDINALRGALSNG